jgi:hypothetical protein
MTEDEKSGGDGELGDGAEVVEPSVEQVNDDPERAERLAQANEMRAYAAELGLVESGEQAGLRRRITSIDVGSGSELLLAYADSLATTLREAPQRPVFIHSSLEVAHGIVMVALYYEVGEVELARDEIASTLVQVEGLSYSVDGFEPIMARLEEFERALS